MKIAYEHLLSFLIDKPSIKDLSNALFQLGHEHEINDLIFDMEFTPNRGDCLSLLGLARDLNVFFKTKLKLPIYQNEIPAINFNFINNAENKCPEISFLNIEIKNQKSEYKKYLNDYFKDFQLNRNNLFTDISNYLAYEMGQPTHCYDSSLIKEGITLKESLNNVKFKALNGKNITLNESDLVFTSNDNIINLAGIMGGMETACSKKTKNVIVECAYFIPESIIGKATKYDLHSDASHKFERGVDPTCHDLVLRRFIQIVADHSEITSLGIYTNSNKKFQNIKIDYDLDKINKIIGIKTSNDQYKNCLNKLGFKQGNKIHVPSYRTDITNQNDLAEELARVIGYNNIPRSDVKIPKMTNRSEYFNEQEIKSFLIRNGFIEVINPPFCNKLSKNSIKVDNPLDTNREYLRTNLTNSLLDNLVYNEKRQKDSIKIFEISNIYSSEEEILNDKRLSIIVSGRRGHNYKDFSKYLDKNYLVDLFKQVDLDIENKITNISREDLKSKHKEKIFSIEVSIKEICEYFKDYTNLLIQQKEYVQYKKISEFPSSYRDFSFSINDKSKINNVIKRLQDFKSDHLRRSFMFDFYENKKTNTTKIGYRFIFQANNKTLTDEEIDKIIDHMLAPILSIESVSLPGLS